MKHNNPTRMLTTLSVLTAFSIVLMLLIHFPIFPAAPYLEYEPMDVPILIAGFVYGPLAGIAVTIVSSLIQGLTVSAAVGGWVGILMHFIASGTLVIVASFIYRKNHSLKGAIIGLIAGTIAMAAIMIPANLIFTPVFNGIPVDAVKALLLPIIIPFNLVKAGINAVVTFIIYKPLRRFVIKNVSKKTVTS
ncbi:MAG: ECF transporter S component [Christensenellales bacterium]